MTENIGECTQKQIKKIAVCRTDESIRWRVKKNNKIKHVSYVQS